MTARADKPPRRVYGRRQGRPLRPRLVQLIEQRLPALRIALPPDGRLPDPAGLFPARPQRLWLEIGFGGGEHLAWQAAQHPEVGLIGAEIFLNGVATALRAIDEGGLTNVRLYTEDARDLLDALPEASLERAFILFPDPWPKKRHHQRRIVQEETLARLARLLRDGGELRLATDDQDYLVWMLQHLDRQPDFLWTATRAEDWRRRPDDWPPTRYEQKALAEGRKPTYLVYRRQPR